MCVRKSDESTKLSMTRVDASGRLSSVLCTQRGRKVSDWWMTIRREKRKCFRTKVDMLLDLTGTPVMFENTLTRGYILSLSPFSLSHVSKLFAEPLCSLRERERERERERGKGMLNVSFHKS